MDGICRIPVDEGFAMIPSELEKAIKADKEKGYIPFCVVATIGTTSSTAVDPVNDVCLLYAEEEASCIFP